MLLIYAVGVFPAAFFVYVRFWLEENKLQEFDIEVTETLQRIVKIKAESFHDAISIAETQYFNGEIVLDSSDFKEREIKCINEPVNIKNKRRGR